jgi:TonB family protein
MRSAIIGSALAHVALIGALLFMRPSIAHIVPGPDVVQVALIDPSDLAAAAPSPAPPAPAPAPKIETPPPAEPKGIRIEKPKKKPPEKPVQKQEPPEEPREVAPPPAEPPSAAPRVTLPMASIGNAGLKGQVAVDGSQFEFAYYLALIRSRIGQVWSPPAGLATGGAVVRAVVYFRIERDGRIAGARLETSSGVEFFDRSALRAVTLSDPMPPLPLGYGGGDLGVHFGFEYAAP